MNLDFGQDIVNFVDKVIKKTENYLQSDEVICACYLYKYVETNNLEYYNRYRLIFDKLDETKKQEVTRTFITFVKNNKRVNSHERLPNPDLGNKQLKKKLI